MIDKMIDKIIKNKKTIIFFLFITTFLTTLLILLDMHEFYKLVFNIVDPGQMQDIIPAQLQEESRQPINEVIKLSQKKIFHTILPRNWEPCSFIFDEYKGKIHSAERTWLLISRDNINGGKFVQKWVIYYGNIVVYK